VLAVVIVVVHEFSCYTYYRAWKPEHYAAAAARIAEAGKASRRRSRNLGFRVDGRGTAPFGRRGPALFCRPPTGVGSV